VCSAFLVLLVMVVDAIDTAGSDSQQSRQTVSL